MEARIYRLVALVACLVSLGASHRTQNFMVTANSPELSREVADAAEAYRRELAIEWLGTELEPWRDPCPITVHEGAHLGAGGATSFMFEQRHPFGWTMSVQGSRERILDSVLPHEITHTIFATHFGRPLPRWADEGACTTVEHSSEKSKQKRLLVEFLTTGRGIAFNQMFRMKEYPPDVLPLYSQGYSLARYLIAQGGKRKFVQYVGDGMDWNDWTRATVQHYGFQNLSDLQVTWLDWVRQGSPSLQPGATQVVSNAESTQPERDAVQLVSADESKGAIANASFSKLPGSSSPGRASSEGWYARVRDKSLPTHSEPAPKARRLSRVASSTPAPHTQSLSRPQPVGRTQPRVIQWSSDGPAAAPQPGSYLVPRGTILR